MSVALPPGQSGWCALPGPRYGVAAKRLADKVYPIFAPGHYYSGLPGNFFRVISYAGND